MDIFELADSEKFFHPLSSQNRRIYYEWEFDFLENMKDEEELLFKRCIRKLLDATFIIEDRDERLYQYLSVESNCYDVSAFLRKIGYDVVVEDKLKVAMLVQNEADLDTVGIKRSNLVVFDGKQVQMLLALWLLYLEMVGFSEEIYMRTPCPGAENLPEIWR